jgi:hypothetical protein
MEQPVIQGDFNSEKRMANATVNLRRSPLPIPYSLFARYAASAASFLPFSTASSMVPTM